MKIRRQMIKKEVLKNNRAITLIVLAITIVILLILSGITIATITGENGLFARAKQAKEESTYANAAEKVKLAVNASYDETANLNKEFLKENLNKIDGIYLKVKEITYDLSVTVDGYQFIITELGQVTAVGRTETLPDNKPDTDAGTEVKLKDEWGSQTVRYIKTSDGTEVTGVETVATVYAVSDGKGNSIPVPYGFFYVGGNLDTGVIISDNEADKYDGKIDKTTWEYNTQLKGNQFVWIPSTKEEYHKTDWGTTYQDGNWDTTTSGLEIAQIQKYGGFYVARYEAGLASTIPEFTEPQQYNLTNQIYNKEGIPQSKAGQIPWNFIDWNHAKKNAESMYNTKTVNSVLITGTQWDVMLNKLVEKTDLEEADLISSSKWGNYRDTAIKYKGRISTCYVSSGYWWQPAFGDIKEGTTSIYNSDRMYGDLLTTGASKTTEKYHTYDVAGNLWEWNEEVSTYGKDIGLKYRECRGGGALESYEKYSSCYRYEGNKESYTDISIGFRVVLYIK